MTKEENKALVERFPFLLPHNRWTDKVPEDYDYRFTELDAMPDGWRIAFGEQMCQEIKDALIEIDYLYKYRIAQIKEKYGMLCWYDFGAPQKVYDIVSKYEDISKQTCMRCGKPATRITTGWISPYCDACLPHYEGKPFQSVLIEEFYDKSDKPLNNQKNYGAAFIDHK